MQYLVVLGRQPAISLAELTSLFPESVRPLNTNTALITADQVNLDRLGGSLKLAEVIGTFPKIDLESIISELAQLLSPLLPPGKLAIGLSLIEMPVKPKSGFALALELKKHLQSAGHAVRVVPGIDMTAAQIQHNHMISQGADIVITKTDDGIIVGLTRQVQDIERYAERDHGRPARSAKVGMLPPKLAQIMINLANPEPGGVILDPFCGTGVVLQEALLMGYQAYGSDIESDLVAMSKRNLEWLKNHFEFDASYRLEAGDATTYQWHQPIAAVVTEGYLGPALTASPTAEQLRQLKADAQALTLAFLSNLRPQLAATTPICLTLPTWRINGAFHGLDMVDQITALGYTLKQFLAVNPADLIYARPDQIVGRELVTLITNPPVLP